MTALVSDAPGSTRGPVRYRPARPEDTRAMHQVFHESIAEVDRRVGSVDAVDIDDPAAEEKGWLDRRPIFEHLTATADLAWVAETESGRIDGYARSILRDGIRELTEFFVRPRAQGHGLGGELLRRAFPTEGARHRTIIATLEVAALARYLKIGLSARCLVLYVSARPSENVVATDLTAEAMTASARTLASLGRIDRRLLGHVRPEDHRWLLDGRQGFLYRRSGRVVGYGYVGQSSGPVAALDPADTPAILAHLESRAAAAGVEELGIWLPTVNREATEYLLGRRFRIDPFIATFLSDDPGVKLDRYLITSPPFFL